MPEMYTMAQSTLFRASLYIQHFLTKPSFQIRSQCNAGISDRKNDGIRDRPEVSLLYMHADKWRF